MGWVGTSTLALRDRCEETSSSSLEGFGLGLIVRLSCVCVANVKFDMLHL